MVKCFPFQKKYLLKFSTDGYALTNLDGGVQGCVRLIQVKDDWHPVAKDNITIPSNLRTEICIFHLRGTPN